MEALLTDFRLDPPTWFYLSLLLIVSIYFRFNRIWSLRNLDLVLLLSLSPGLLIAEADSRLGFVWLFGASASILVRLLADPFFSRRPRLSQNLNSAGLIFLLVACGVFHVGKILTVDPLPASSIRTVDQANSLVERRDDSVTKAQNALPENEPAGGPATTIFTAPFVSLSKALTRGDVSHNWPVRLAAILAHASLIAAFFVMAWRLFGDSQLGAAMATLYVVVPCTAYHVAQINHVMPCALILWAFIFFRNPFIAGGLLGLACGTLFFPVFLLPIWMTFYGWQNSLRFVAALASVWVVMLGSITFTSVDAVSFVRQVFSLFDWSMLSFSEVETTGVWAGIPSVYRIPVFALFVVMVGLLSWWPKGRSVDLLLARSTAVIIGTQFWYPQEGGAYLLWYVPLLLAVVFRPTLSQLTPPPATCWPWSRRDQPVAARFDGAPPAGIEPVRPLFR
ncbi:MAG: hypothetical protein M3552_17490 [Planctomycetota bacterium]|nr:hypothetical protein [Planctomycetaceae bacterium]MDQ3332413.1 hypothetical protein [Planctomycetota bacterium]